MIEFNTLKGKTFTEIEIIKNDPGKDDKIIFKCSDGTAYSMYHEQNCCESVSIEDITGDISDILNSEILVAEESSGDLYPNTHEGYTPESQTWTFYKLATINGWVDIRWYGESNGYYSESVFLYKII